MNIRDIKHNDKNPRVIKDDKFKKLVKSIKDFPQMMELRPIIINEDNIIQGGNMRYKALQELGYKDIPDNWVKKASDLTPEQWKEFVIKDNIGFGEWDYDVLSTDWDSDKLVEWGLDIEKQTEDKEYTTKVESPIYLPKKDKPKIDNLFNLDKYEELKRDIDSSSISEEDKLFLEYAAKRHIEFNYAEIAEYYAHSDDEVKKLMEDSALIIIDYDKAIEKGFVKLYDLFNELAENNG